MPSRGAPRRPLALVLLCVLIAACQETTPIPTPVPTSSNTATTTSAATSAPGPPSAAGIVVDAAEIARHLDALAQIADQNAGIRAAGTPGYVASADYVAAQLEQAGYDVQRMPVDFTFFDEAAPVVLDLGDQSWSGSEWLHAMLYSAPGDVSGPVESVAIEGGAAVGTAGCDPSDWSSFTRGDIAIVFGGPCFRRDQVTLAQQAGAVALVALYTSWQANQARRPTLVDPSGITIPAIAVGSEPAAALLAAAETRAVAHIQSSVEMRQAFADNVIASLLGSSDRIVMLGGHLDSVLDGPGINDNGSGVATLLAIAASLSRQPQPAATVRFGFWTGEELGDLGSAAYVAGLPEGDFARFGAYLNLDMVSSPNAARFVYANAGAPAGSGAITDDLLAALDALGAPGQALDIGPASDHYAFQQAGIAIGGVFSGLGPLTPDQAALFGGRAGVPADACYHLACDTRANVDIENGRLLGQAIAEVLQELIQPSAT